MERTKLDCKQPRLTKSQLLPLRVCFKPKTKPYEETILGNSSTLFIIKDSNYGMSFFMIPNNEPGIKSFTDGEISGSMDHYDQRVEMQQHFGVGLNKDFIRHTDCEQHDTPGTKVEDCNFCTLNGPPLDLKEETILHHYLLGEDLLKECLYEKYRLTNPFLLYHKQSCISILLCTSP